MFFVFEGIDNVGKTTLLKEVAKILEDQGLQVLCHREPAGDGLGETIRNIVKTQELDDFTRICLFNGLMNHNYNNTIKPALDKGYIVISDRWFESCSYQEQSLLESKNNIDWQFLQASRERFNQILQPTQTFLIKRDTEQVELANDVFESQGREYLAGVANRYDVKAQRNGWVFVDNNRNPKIVALDIARIILRYKQQ